MNRAARRRAQREERKARNKAERRREQLKAISSQHQAAVRQTDAGPKDGTLDGHVDAGWVGLALLVPVLRKGWRRGDLGELGFWRARRERSLKILKGESRGDYVLHPDQLFAFLAKYHLSYEVVVTAWSDHGITRTDVGHLTKVARVGGVLKRMVVLPDRYVVSRNPRKLGSSVGRAIGREKHAGQSSGGSNV